MNLYVAPGRLNGCNNAIIIPSLQVQQRLTVGDNYVEFTPQAVGNIAYSCWMAMIHARITVIDREAVAQNPIDWLAGLQAGRPDSEAFAACEDDEHEDEPVYSDDCCP